MQLSSDQMNWMKVAIDIAELENDRQSEAKVVMKARSVGNRNNIKKYLETLSEEELANVTRLYPYQQAYLNQVDAALRHKESPEDVNVESKRELMRRTHQEQRSEARRLEFTPFGEDPTTTDEED